MTFSSGADDVGAGDVVGPSGCGGTTSDIGTDVDIRCSVDTTVVVVVVVVDELGAAGAEMVTDGVTAPAPD